MICNAHIHVKHYQLIRIPSCLHANHGSKRLTDCCSKQKSGYRSGQRTCVCNSEFSHLELSTGTTFNIQMISMKLPYLAHQARSLPRKQAQDLFSRLGCSGTAVFSFLCEPVVVTRMFLPLNQHQDQIAMDFFRFPKTNQLSFLSTITP